MTIRTAMNVGTVSLDFPSEWLLFLQRMDDTEQYFIQAAINLRAHGHGPNFFWMIFFSLGFFRFGVVEVLRWEA